MLKISVIYSDNIASFATGSSNLRSKLPARRTFGEKNSNIHWYYLNQQLPKKVSYT